MTTASDVGLLQFPVRLQTAYTDLRLATTGR